MAGDSSADLQRARAEQESTEVTGKMISSFRIVCAAKLVGAEVWQVF